MHENDKLNESKPLRDFQRTALATMATHFDAGKKRVCFVAPTGAGKTRCAVEYIRGEAQRDQRVVVLAHRAELIDQMSGTLDEAGIEHGIIKARHPRYAPSAMVQVATVQTLHRRLANAPPADCLVVDECHRVMAKTYLDIVDKYQDARMVGLTATPWRLDNKGLGNVYEDLVLAATPNDLVEKGFLIAPTFFAPSRLDLSSVRVNSFGEFEEKDVAKQLNTDTLCGDVIDHWQRISPGERTMVFACNVEHSKALCARFQKAGVAAAHVDGNTPFSERQDAVAKLRSGEITVLCNVNIATEGLDVPELRTVVLAMVTKSITRYLQAVGRVMRPAVGKGQAFVIDHGGCVYLHGLPTDERQYELSACPGEGDETPAFKACPQCKALLKRSARVCELCGHQYQKQVLKPVKETGSELEIFTSANTFARNDDSEGAANSDSEISTVLVKRRSSIGSHGLPCVKCGGETREIANAGRWGKFARLMKCMAGCGTNSRFVTHADYLRATDAEIEAERRRLMAFACDRGWSLRWVAKTMERQLREAHEYAIQRQGVC